MWGIKGGDVFKQPRQEQLESCGGAQGWGEVYGHHLPLWDLWTLDAGCYLLLGWTDTYCWELPTPPPSPPYLHPVQQAHSSDVRAQESAEWNEKGSPNGVVFELVWAQSYFWNRSTRFCQAENIPSCLQRVCPTLSHAPPSNSSFGISVCLLETTDVTSWD